jgi:hypothetical protein
MMRQSLRLGTCSMMVIAVACQTAGGGPRASLLSHDASAAPLRGAQSNRVRADELKMLANESLEQALFRLRPNFFRINPSGATRPGSAERPGVYIDNSYAGALDVLRLVPVPAVIEVVYLPPSSAHDRFGAYCPCSAGVIAVVTRRSRP